MELGNKRLFNMQMEMPLLRFLSDTSPREVRWKTGQREEAGTASDVRSVL